MRISGLRSVWNESRRALFVGARRVAVYQRENGQARRVIGFANDEAGREQCRRYLAEAPPTPVTMLVDVAEEEYRRELIPRVSAADRRALLKRRAARLFKGTPYCFHRLTGREKDGRRDHRIFLAALTSPTLISPWTTMLAEAKTPLTAICSLPLFSETLLRQLTGQRAVERQLLVSLQAVSGLRQSFFENGALQLSRLVQVAADAGAPSFPQLRDEVEKVLRYLDSLKAISPEEPLHICFLSAGELSRKLRDEYGSREDLLCRFHEPEKLGNAAGQDPTGAPFSDLFFMEQALARKPQNYYAGARERRYARLRQLRRGARVAGVLLLSASLGCSALNLLQATASQRRGNAAQEQARAFVSGYEQARAKLPKTPAPPADLQAAVTIAQSLVRQRAVPDGLWSVLGEVLGQFPTIQVRKLSWTARAGADAPSTNAARRSADYEQTRRHSATMEAGIAPFDGDFREALATINRFAERLRIRRELHGVELLSLPLDVSPDASLQGSAPAPRRQAEFILRVVAEAPIAIQD